MINFSNHITYQHIVQKHQLIQYDEEKYFIIELIAKTRISDVYKAYNINNQKYVVFKIIQNDKLEKQPLLKQYLEREKKFLERIQSPYIVKLLQFQQNDKSIQFIFEYCEQGTLLDYINENNIIYYKTAFNIMYQIIQGVKVLRENNIMHRDIKPENIFIKQGQLKIGDLGSAQDYSNLNPNQNYQFSRVGTFGYLAPEILERDQYSTNVDVYSLGVIFIYLINGEHPFIKSNTIQSNLKSESQQNLLNQQKNANIEFKQNLPECLAQLINEMIEFKPENRLTLDFLIKRINQIKIHNQIERLQFGDIYYFGVQQSEKNQQNKLIQVTQIQEFQSDIDLLKSQLMKLEKEQEEINSYISFLYHELYKILHWMYTLEKLKKFIDFKLNFNLQIDFYVILMRQMLTIEELFNTVIKKNGAQYLIKREIPLEKIYQNEVYQRFLSTMKYILFSNDGYQLQLIQLQDDIQQFIKNVKNKSQTNNYYGIEQLKTVINNMNLINFKKQTVQKAYDYFFLDFYNKLNENFLQEKKKKYQKLIEIKILLGLGAQYYIPTTNYYQQFKKFNQFKILQNMKKKEAQTKANYFSYDQFMQDYASTIDQQMKQFYIS